MGLPDTNIQIGNGQLPGQCDPNNVTDVVFPNYGKIRKSEYKKLEKYQESNEELERDWQVMAAVSPVVI